MIHKEKKAKQRVGRKSGRYEHDPWRPVQTKISSESPDFKKPCFAFLCRSVLQSHFCQHGHTWDFIVSPLRSLQSLLKHSVFIHQLCHGPSSPRDSDLFPCWDLYLLEWPTSPSLLFAFWLNRFCCIFLSNSYSFTYLKTFDQVYHANSWLMVTWLSLLC